MVRQVFIERVSLITTSALLFDMDGVLIDSTPAVARVWHRWALEHGFDPEQTVRRAHGRPSITTIRELLPNADHELENREVERREIEDLVGVVALPGALDLLGALPHERWAIVTSSTRPLAEVRMRAAGLPQPQFFVTSSDVVHGKPHPEPYIKAARGLGFSPDRCVVLEDAPAGIRAGKSAGSLVIAFRTTVPEADLLQAKPDWIVADCTAITVEGMNADGDLSLAIR